MNVEKMDGFTDKKLYVKPDLIIKLFVFEGDIAYLSNTDQEPTGFEPISSAPEEWW